MPIKPAEPWGNPLLAPFFIRISLGAYFLIAGLAKLNYLPDFVAIVKQFGILPEAFATLYGVALPYIEIGVGGLLLAGLWTTLAGFIAALLLFSFIVALGLFPYQLNRNLFNKDLILLAAALSVMYSGSGAYSMDRLRKSG